MEKLVLIDGHSILNRAFYGVPILTNTQGLHTNAVYGFLNILFKLVDEEKPAYLAVAFDLKAPTFRHNMFEQYKGTRKPMPEELHEQVPLIKEVLSAMKIPILTKEGYEADDILGTVAKQAQNAGLEVTVVSGDRDLLQLADTHIKISIPKTSRGTTEVHNYYPEDVEREYQVSPTAFIDVKALMGDTSDNIPGIPSVGEKTATNLIVQFGSVEGVYDHLDEVKPPRAKKALEENRELAKLSYDLAKICREAPVEFSKEETRLGELFTKEAYEVMSRLELKSILSRFSDNVKKVQSECRCMVVSELSKAEEIFSAAEKADRIGAELLLDGTVFFGMALSYSETEAYLIIPEGFVTKDYLCEKLTALCKTGKVWFLHLKSSLSHLALGYGDRVYDAGVAAYLINPLKDAYEYDDLSRDYLETPLPSRAELLKKQTFEAAWETEQDTVLSCAAYMSNTVLFEKMGIKGGKKTKTGYSTAADVLEKLAPDYPVVRKILDYRQYSKLNSTYAEGLGTYIAPDGRIHSSFNQTITATGRISSTEPNLQNIPIRMALGREIRKVFVPKDGFVFLDADYSQIELRVLAHLSGDERLIEAYRSAQDIHAITASQVFHIPLDEVTPLQRRNAKAVNFGIVYGISAFGLSEDLSISRKEALEYINCYFETYPQVKSYLDNLVKEAKETGYAVTMFGRRRPVPELKSGNFMQRSFGERVAMNSPIQGTAADIIKIAMIRVDKRLREEGLRSRLILQVHDELLLETATEEEPAVKKLLAEEMTGAAKLKVELEIDMHDGKNWFEAK